jgi:hypothetical protein
MGGGAAPAAGLDVSEKVVCLALPTTEPQLGQPGHYTVMYVTKNCFSMNCKCRGKSQCANAKAVTSHVGMFRNINHA